MLTLNDTIDTKTALDDYLTAASQTGVATEMLSTLEAAIANVNAINDDVYTALSGADDETQCKVVAADGAYNADSTSDVETFCALQYQVKQFTDVLKWDFTQLTSFTIPASASGDND